MRSSKEISTYIKESDYSGCSATLVGLGFMGKHYFRALQALNVSKLRICSRSYETFQEIRDCSGLELYAGGYQNLDITPGSEELGIIATPTKDLVNASMHLVDLGFKHILVEKPVDLLSESICALDNYFETHGVQGYCGYNRVAYPSLLELKYLSEQDGGITSCKYEFTELIDRIDRNQFTHNELSRWGIANSLHVVSMAHSVIGLPAIWEGYISGKSVEWHPTGSIFVGSGFSNDNIPFVFHADWGSKGRWSVEFRTSERAYLLCPLEQLFCKMSSTGDWEEIEIDAFDASVKTGIAEELSAILDSRLNNDIPLVSLRSACELTKFGERVFGYHSLD